MQLPDRLWGSARLLFSAYRAPFSPEAKRPDYEALSSAKKKNAWSYTSTVCDA